MAKINVRQNGEYLDISRNILNYRKEIGKNIYVLLCLSIHPEFNDLLIANELDMNLDEVITSIVSLQKNGFVNYEKRFHGAIPRIIPMWLKEEILERDHYCVKCGSFDNLEIDHIIPVSKGGSSEKENLQILCKTCNKKKAAKMEELINGK